jgi:sterol desaturase/sphingolipid hydroxylase (fatty acid hydroxylase superfamily)
MVSVISIAKFFVINLFFGGLGFCLYFHRDFLFYSVLSTFITTVAKNYFILGILESYAMLKPKIEGDERPKPIAKFFGELHLYWWMASAVESFTIFCLLNYCPSVFSARVPESKLDLISSYLWFFPMMFLFEFIFDFFHYWIHRKAHCPPFYKWLHKTHHLHRYPTGIITFYQNPIDLILSNSIPSFLAFFMMYSILGVQWDMFQFSLLLVFKSLVEIGGHLGK